MRAFSARYFYLGLVWLVLFCEMLLAGWISFRTQPLWFHTSGDEFDFVLEKGTSFNWFLGRIRQKLNSDLRTPLAVYSRLTGADRRIQQGKYVMGPDWSPVQTLEQMLIGPNNPDRAVIIPGYTLAGCAQTLESAGWIQEASDFLEAASGERVATGNPFRTYEGLLAPETYFFDSIEAPERVLREMAEEWKAKVRTIAGTDDWDARMPNGLTLYNTIILASLIEKEAAGSIEMASVSSVFHNRLRKNWPLGSAASLRYAIRDWEKEDHELPSNLKSPFNTNKKPGLPPHPICLSSLEALQAALHPAQTDYFYFSADGKGGTVFNQTHQGHISSVKDYRERIKNSAP